MRTPTPPRLEEMDKFQLVRSTLRRRVTPDHASTQPPRSVGDDRRKSIRDPVVVVAALAFSVAVALAVTWALWPPSAPPALPRAAPDFTLPTDLGPPATLSERRGSVVVIHFVILVCCAYSALEVGYMMEVEPGVREQGVVFISIAMDSEYNYFSPEKYRELMGFNWTLALDSDGSVQRLYGAEETSTFVIDRDGMIRYQDNDTTPPDRLTGWIRRVV